MRHNTITPYQSGESKEQQVAQMFNAISRRYDFLNSLLSLGIHKRWRKKCVRILSETKTQQILDVATGTADFAIECASLPAKNITGIDISEGMLRIGREKVKKKNLGNIITLQTGNAETVNFPDRSFDAIVVGFGVRNFQNLEAGLKNMRRMLRPGGTLIVLEFSYPKNPVIKSLYNFYFTRVTPFIGRIFSKDKRAYSYLNESVKAFPNNEKFTAILQGCGYEYVSFELLCFGVAAIYKARV